MLESLDKIEIPAKVDLKLAIDITAVQLQMTLSGDDMATLPATGYLKIGEEVIYYAAINTTTGIASSLTRGYLRTTAATHNDNDKVQPCQYYGPANPFDQMLAILDDAGIAGASIDTAAFTNAENVPGDDLSMEALISEPTKAGDLYYELIDLMQCKTWVGENNKITIARDLPNKPGRIYTTLTDDENIIDKSASVDLNQKSRISRCALYWDPIPLGKIDEVADYNRLDLAVDADAEGVNEYDEIAEKKIMCRWLNSTLAAEETVNDYVQALVIRQVALHRDPLPLLSMDAEIKDAALLTGQFAKITTDEILNASGSDLTLQPFQIVKRERKPKGIISLTALRIIQKRYLIISPPAAADEIDWFTAGAVAITWFRGVTSVVWPIAGAILSWANATAAQKEYGAICNTNNLMSDGDFGSRIW